MAAAIPPKVSRIVDILVSIAAQLVIVAALFIIEHWKGADTMLSISNLWCSLYDIPTG